MRMRCVFAPAAGMLAAITSIAAAQPKVEEVVLGPAAGASYSSYVPHVSKTRLHVALQVSKGSCCDSQNPLFAEVE